MLSKLCARAASVPFVAIVVSGAAEARPVTHDPPCRASLSAVEVVALEQSLETVAAGLGCPGTLRSVEVLAEDLRFQTRVWQIDVWPYGELRAEFINGQLHGMTKAWLDLSVTY